jgi:hypothetical protein
MFVHNNTQKAHNLMHHRKEIGNLLNKMFHKMTQQEKRMVNKKKKADQ